MSEFGKGFNAAVVGFVLAFILCAVLLRKGMHCHIEIVSDVPIKHAAISNQAGFCSDDGRVWWRMREDGVCYEVDKP